MTEESIIKLLASFTDNRKYPFQLPRAFIYNWECDFWTLDSCGNSREFEIKVSFQDFLNDAKKEKHSSCNGANYFYYVCPAWLILKGQVNRKYGLIYVHENGNITIEKKPQKLHENKFDNWKMLANKMYWKWYSLWHDKWVSKEITRAEWVEGFNIEISKDD